MPQTIDIKTNPQKTEQIDRQKTAQRLKKQINRASHLQDICKALTVGTIGMAAIGEAIIGFEGIAVAGTAVAIACAPLLATSFIAKKRELKLEQRLTDIKRQALKQAFTER